MWRPRSPVQAELTSGPVRPIRIVKGLDIPIRGEPEQVISDGGEVGAVALLGDDYAIQHPSLRVQEGDLVKLGQPLFADRRRPRVLITSPGAGSVRQINRGARRALQSIVIDLEGDDQETFEAWSAEQLAALRRDQVIDRLLESGLWAEHTPQMRGIVTFVSLLLIAPAALAQQPAALGVGEKPRVLVMDLESKGADKQVVETIGGLIPVLISEKHPELDVVSGDRNFAAAASAKQCNCVLIKPNQAGTISETKAALDAAKDARYATIVSARSGESEDTAIAHLAVGWDAGQFKVGSFSRSERMAKWNEMLRIEEAAGANAQFAGRAPLLQRPVS